jgi:hypothetical protein
MVTAQAPTTILALVLLAVASTPGCRQVMDIGARRA